MRPDQLESVIGAVQTTADLNGLRGRFPDLHFTFCSEDDVSPRIAPVAEAGDYLIYLVSGASGHCLAFTPDLAGATGVVVASCSED